MNLVDEFCTQQDGKHQRHIPTHIDDVSGCIDKKDVQDISKESKVYTHK